MAQSTKELEILPKKNQCKKSASNMATSREEMLKRQWILMFGKPKKFRSDGGSQFDCMEMRNFLKEYGIKHGQSSSYIPQRNGHAERIVKIVKELLMKTDTDVISKNFLDGIAQIRNTPRTDRKAMNT